MGEVFSGATGGLGWASSATIRSGFFLLGTQPPPLPIGLEKLVVCIEKREIW